MTQDSQTGGGSAGRNVKDGVVGELEWQFESQERSLDRISDWIKGADSKATTLLAIDTTMIAAIVGLSVRPGGWTQWSGVWILIGGAALVASLAMVALSALPQLAARAPSLLFFGDIASMSSDEYSARVESRSTSDYLRDLNSQCHRCSEIATRKYRWIRGATMVLIAGILPWMVALFLIVQA